MADSNSDFSTILGADALFKGELKFEKGVRLLGKFEGQINSAGQLVIADGAMLTGDVKANHIRVDGEVKGNLDATQKMELTASAKVEGDLQTARLEVAEGAVLIGRCMVGVNGQGGPSGTQRAPSRDHKATSPPPTQTDAPKVKGNVPEPVGAKK